MGLTYHFSFGAPKSASADELEEFLLEIEQEAIQMGFDPTTVINGPFDTAERREFAKRVARGIPFEDECLKGVSLPSTQYWSHNPATGSCRIAPEHGVLLVVTDKQGCEIVFGFFRYPRVIRDLTGRKIITVPGDEAWVSGDCVKSPDQRYRAIVRRFAAAGYLTSELDEFVPAAQR